MNAPAPAVVTSLQGEELAPVALLHNMSMRPTTAVHRQGNSRCRGLRIGIGEALAKAGIAKGELVALCRHFGLEVGRGADAGKALAAFLDATARASSLPAVAAVLSGDALPTLAPSMARVDDLALALAVASKSSRSVFVRAKTPFVSQLWSHEILVLVMPEPGDAATPAGAEAVVATAATAARKEASARATRPKGKP